MGRYLNLARDAVSAANAERSSDDKDDRADQKCPCEGLRSFRSFISYPGIRPTIEVPISRLSRSAPSADQKTAIEPAVPVPPAACALALTTKTTETTKPFRNRWEDEYEERAAIVEYDAKIPRAWAEGFARLHPDRIPGNVPTQRWQQFVEDVGVFLGSPFCAVAAAFGWGSHDLFGADRDRPFARVDQAGLIWLLNGDKLVALTKDEAAIERKSGAQQTYRRKPNEPYRVLAWELEP